MSLNLDPRLLDVNKAGIGSDPSNFTAVGPTTFFVAFDRAHGSELYETDGSVDGTRLVKDIHPGTTGSDITGMTALNGLLLSFADDGTHGEELWKSDGTEHGTRLVADINPGSGNSAPTSSSLNTTAVSQGKMFFAAADGANGRQLWATDGMTRGTAPVADINPGPAGSNPAALTVFNGKLYFQATHGAGGSQLFASDGTAAGTAIVKAISPNGDAFHDGSTSTMMADLGGVLFFVADVRRLAARRRSGG